MQVLYAACLVVYFCTNALAAPLLTPAFLLLLGSANVSLTAPASLTHPSLDHLPPDPFFYHDPNSNEIVRFYNFGIRLNREDVVGSLIAATRDIERHARSDEPIPDHIVRYAAHDVFLLMHHHGRMTWRAWETALRGIAAFLARFEYVDMDFDVGQTGEEQFFGTGVLGKFKNRQLDA